MFFAYFFYFSSFIACIVNPFWGLVALIVSVLIRFQDRIPEIAAIRPFSLLFLGLIIGCIVNRDKLAKHVWKQDNLLLGMLGFSFLCLVVLNPGDLISETWQFISSLAFYFFASRIMQTRRQFIILFAVMSCCIAYMGLEAILDVMKNPETSIFLDVRNGRWQGLGYYQNANEFGQLMITTLPFLFAALIMKNNILIKAMAVGLIILLIYVVGKSGSRTVMVLLGMMVILTFALRGQGNAIKKVFVSGIVGTVLLVGLSFAPGPIQDRLQSVLDAGSDKSFQGRTRAWDQGFQMVTWYPVTGIGKGQWGNYHGLMPHNSYVQILAELGPVGIFLFLWVLRLSAQEFRTAFFKSQRDPPTIQENEIMEPDVVVHPIWGTPQTGEKVSKTSGNVPAQELDNETKTVIIAVAVVMIAWLAYIFLGNQAYAVWTYFYIGLCAAVRNLLPENQNRITSNYRPSK